MKKTLSIVVCVMVLISLVVGCSNPPGGPSSSGSIEESGKNSSSGSSSASTTKKQVVFGFSPPTMNNPFFLWINQNLKEAVEANGDKLITVDPQLDPQKQISQIEDLLTQNIDVLLLAAFDSTSIKSALVAANSKGVPIIVMDTPVMNPEMVKTTVASDNFQAGFVVGEDMAKRLQQGDEVAVIISPAGETDRLRLAGFKKGIGDKLKIIVELDGKGDTGVTLPIAEDVLQGYPNVRAFFCGNDPSAIGAVQACSAVGKTNILIYGIDGSPEAKAAIKAGKMQGTGAQSPTSIAKYSVDAAYKVLAGETVDANTVVPTFLINQENIDKYGTDGWQ